jgi:hypothetical protein
MNLMRSELLELLAEIERHAVDIYVRDYDAEGRIGTVALADLPAKAALRHALRFLENGRMPVVVVRGPEGTVES